MPIVAKAGADFVLCPAGTHAAVCVDVVDLGELEVNFAGKTKRQHKVRVVWQIDENKDDGKPFIASKRYTLSLHEKAALRKDLESWRGRAFTSSELEGFDLEALLSVGCLLNVIHESKNGKTYDNIASIMRLPKAMEAPRPRDYIRVCDRKTESQQMPPQFDESMISDDDVPF